MKAHRKILALAVALAIGGEAAAQATDESNTAREGWTTYARERHFVGRVSAGGALSLSRPYGAPLLAPPWAMVDGSYTFINVGPVRMGPHLGVQLGFDPRSTIQVAVQPGWFALWRLTPLFALTARADLSILNTRGRAQTVALTQDFLPVRVIDRQTRTFGIGAEVGVGGALFLTSGLALTAELNGGVYFGDSGYTFPLLGAGLGVLVDYELLP